MNLLKLKSYLSLLKQKYPREINYLIYQVGGTYHNSEHWEKVSPSRGEG